MRIDLNNAFTFVSLGVMLISGIYQLARIESNINAKITKAESDLLAAIDALKDNFSDRLYTVEKKIDVHLTEYGEKKQFTEYRFNDIDKRIEHKFTRLANWIKQIAGFLNKSSDFHIRDDQF
jgi:hypothetical protein